MTDRCYSVHSTARVSELSSLSDRSTVLADLRAAHNPERLFRVGGILPA